MTCSDRPTVCVSGGWEGRDKTPRAGKARSQEKPENSYSTHPSAARFVVPLLILGWDFDYKTLESIYHLAKNKKPADWQALVEERFRVYSK